MTERSSRAVEPLLIRVEQACQRGEIWRAKEMLQGAVKGATGYDPAIFERLGQILLQMGDLIEAGKYLFLSGRREPAYEQPINLYLQRHARRQPAQLYSTFPRCARLAHRELYPEAVATKLRELGQHKFKRRHGRKQNQSTLMTRLSILGCLAFAAALVILAIMGVAWLTQTLSR